MPRKLTKVPESEWSHDRLQSECYLWHVDEYPNDTHLVHQNLNNSVGGLRGSLNKALGLRAGRADSQFFYQNRLYLFEFKVGKDKQSDDQKAFEKANREQGAIYFIISIYEPYETSALESYKGIIRRIHEND